MVRRICGCASRESKATYAVAAFVCDASMTLMPAGGRFGGVTFVHPLPPSRVSWMRPVLVPAQITPAATGDGASDWIDPPAAGAPTPPARPAGAAAGGAPGGAARSGLMARH